MSLSIPALQYNALQSLENLLASEDAAVTGAIQSQAKAVVKALLVIATDSAHTKSLTVSACDPISVFHG